MLHVSNRKKKKAFCVFILLSYVLYNGYLVTLQQVEDQWKDTLWFSSFGMWPFVHSCFYNPISRLLLFGKDDIPDIDFFEREENR